MAKNRIPNLNERKKKMTDEKKRRIVYRSEGTDDVKIVCDSIENAVNVFKADAEAMLDDSTFHNEGMEITLSVVEMTDAEVAAIQDV